MVLWSLVMAVVLVLEVVAPSATITWIGFLATALLGVYLGVNGRVGTVLVAPLVSWLFAAFPLVVATMVHFGVLKGFFYGVLLVTFGWIGIGFCEVVWLGLVAVVSRALSRGRHERPVVVFGPGEDEKP